MSAGVSVPSSVASSVPSAAKTAKKQKLLLFGGGAALFTGLLAAMYLSEPNSSNAPKVTVVAKTEDVNAVTQQLSNEEIWTNKANAQLQEMNQRNQEMQITMTDLKRRNEELTAKINETEKKQQDATQAAQSVVPPPLPPPSLDSIVPPTQALVPQTQGTPNVVTQLPNGLPPTQPIDANATNRTLPPVDEDEIVHIVVDEVDKPIAPNSGDPNATPTSSNATQTQTGLPPRPVKTTLVNEPLYKASSADITVHKAKAKTYIPSGSFFTAELIAALDAPTGNNASQNPHPTLLVVKDNAFLPNRFRSKVKECHIIASGYGDISSERVNLRTEKMSCVLQDGTVVDTKLNAYIAGEDGKAGLRGRLVSKQGALIANAMLAGTLGGIGQGLAQASTTMNQTSLGTTTTVDPNRVMQYGSYAGAGSALNKLADYYIKSAEQTFPILEIAAGREVTVILLDGLDIEAVDKAVAAASGEMGGQRGNGAIVNSADIEEAGRVLR